MLGIDSGFVRVNSVLTRGLSAHFQGIGANFSTRHSASWRKEGKIMILINAERRLCHVIIMETIDPKDISKMRGSCLFFKVLKIISRIR